jgi:alkanesulfonate monooxygenase SsuD/methylene tetrahydromethanopterin reductase-like flavin-dependent oxidoreductase (luciferase family)
MLEVAVFHNGASDLDVKNVDGVTVVDGSLEAVHAGFQRVLVNQIRQGVLADRLGFNYWFMTEHHFIPEGPEFSPNPLLAEAAIASQTKQIRLGQMANIISWWHPVRLAEQAAMLDVISGGRLDFGIGRGYQPREAEVFGWPYGSTVQDQERNRSYYEEAYRLILKCWTEPSFSHHGEFFSVPPSYTRWNHKQTIAYFSDAAAGRDVNQVLNVGPPDSHSSGSPVMASTTTLREISVFPQPLQKPYPQVWEPVTSERSIRWTARNAVNALTIAEPTSRLKRNIEMYYDEAEKQGWPDRLDRGRWKFGWDAERRRGFGCCRHLHLVRPGADEKKQIARFLRGRELDWEYYGPFGFAAALAEAHEAPYPLTMKVTGDLLLEKEVAIAGTPEHVIEKIMRIKEAIGYEDFLFGCWFEGAGFTNEETEEQMELFASEVMPVLAKECGGQVRNPETGLDFSPGRSARVAGAAGCSD